MNIYQTLLKMISEDKKGLAILIDPEKFLISETGSFLEQIPKQTTHIFIGGSTVFNEVTETIVSVVKAQTSLPLILFPGDFSQLTSKADAVLFLSLISGRNVEYLIEQQLKAVPYLKNSKLEIIPTGYILLDGGNESAVARVTNTRPMSQVNIEAIVYTALAGQFMGAKFIYLEAGSGALYPVKPEVIAAVKKELEIPLIVGGGIKTKLQKNAAYLAGADIVVMGTVFEANPNLKN
jgi:phosphoglycerol geranylgeranyltransferase